MLSTETIHQLTMTVGSTTILLSFWTTVADYSQEGFVIFLAVLWAVWLFQRTRDSWQLPAVITLGQLISYPLSELLQQLFQRLRPYAAGGFNPLTGASPYISTAPDFSLPSNHAVATAVFVYVFFRCGKSNWGWVIAVITVLVGLSRVAVGVHYPLDIISGWLVGAACAVLAYYLELAGWKKIRTTELYRKVSRLFS